MLMSENLQDDDIEDEVNDQVVVGNNSTDRAAG